MYRVTRWLPAGEEVIINKREKITYKQWLEMEKIRLLQKGRKPSIQPKQFAGGKMKIALWLDGKDLMGDIARLKLSKSGYRQYVKREVTNEV